MQHAAQPIAACNSSTTGSPWRISNDHSTSTPASISSQSRWAWSASSWCRDHARATARRHRRGGGDEAGLVLDVHGDDSMTGDRRQPRRGVQRGPRSIGGVDTHEDRWFRHHRCHPDSQRHGLGDDVADGELPSAAELEAARVDRRVVADELKPSDDVVAVGGVVGGDDAGGGTPDADHDRLVGVAFGEEFAELFEALVLVGDDGVLFRFEVSEEGAASDARCRRDVVDGDVIESSGGEQLDGHGGHLSAVARQIAFPQPWRSGMWGCVCLHRRYSSDSGTRCHDGI